MSKTRDYWLIREREARQRQQTLEWINSYNKQIEQTYKQMLDAVQKEIEAFYGRYADAEGITMAEARKRVAKVDIEAYGRKAAKYVKNKTFTEKANAEMKLYNLTMKVNRLELLKSNIGLELVDGFDDLEKYFGKTLTAEGIKEFRRQAGILGDTITDTDKNKRYEKLSDRLARASFHNATFSDRIWMHQDLLKGEIDKALKSAFISGRSMERLARDIKNAFGASTKNVQRLMRTEIRRMQTDVAMESYKKNGNEKYEYMALGQRPCDACRALDGKVFKVKDMEVGLNAPPMHPNCMCSTAPHVDEKEYQEWLDSLDPKDSFRKFTSGDEVNDFFYTDGDEKGLLARKNSLFGKWKSSLTNDEDSAIRWYTADGYGDINDYLRRRSGWEYISKDIEDPISKIDEAISRFTLKEGIVVHRGVEDFYGDSIVEKEEWNDISEIKGKTFRDKGFGSSTALYGSGVATSKPVLFEIEIPAGKGRGAYINKHAGQYEDVEYEFLIARDSRFIITDVIKNKRTIPEQTIIKMRLITNENGR